MAMVSRDDFRGQLQVSLQLCFGSEKGFRDWLDLKNLEAFAPGDEDALVRDSLKCLSFSTEPGQRIPPRDEVIAGLKLNGIDCGAEIRKAFERAESTWPAVAGSNEALVDRILSLIHI